MCESSAGISGLELAVGAAPCLLGRGVDAGLQHHWRPHTRCQGHPSLNLDSQPRL